jgi:glycosyltransferase involved in cell wall biosynthesis
MHFVGNRFREIDDWAREYGISQNVIQHGPLVPEKAQEILDKADVLVLSLYGIKELAYHWCAPGKTYTYLGSGKPILALLPPGEARDLVICAGTGFPVQPDDVVAIEKSILEIYDKYKSGDLFIRPNENFINQFYLPVQQKQFVEVIESAFSDV